jgi:hypothetical protein
LNRAFLSLLMNYNLVLQHEGSNLYKLPHMGKEKLEKRGELPFSIKVWEQEPLVVENVTNLNSVEADDLENDARNNIESFDDAGWLLFLDNDVGQEEIEDCFNLAIDTTDPDLLVEQIVALEIEEDTEKE